MTGGGSTSGSGPAVRAREAIPRTPQELVRWVPATSELPIITDVKVQAFSGDSWDNVRVCRKVTQGRFVIPQGHVASDLVAIVLEAPGREEGRFGRERVTDRGPPGSFSLLPAGMPYTYACDGTRDVLHLSMTAATGADEESAHPVRLRPVFSGVDPLVVQIGAALLHEARRRDDSTRLYAEALGVALGAHLARRYGQDHQPDGEVAPPGMPRREIQRVVDYVEAHLADDLGLADLARVAGMSRTRFLGEFRRATGLSPHRYVTARRIECAKVLLSARDLPLHEIAARAGYADQTTLSRVFRRLTQMSPGAYRRASWS